MTTDQLINFFTRAIHPLKTTVMLLTGKAVVKAVKDTEELQEVQLSALAGEPLDKVPRVQDFGFSSNPPVGSEAIILSLGGSRENVVAIKVDNRKVRIKNLASGETIIFTDDGTFLHLKKSGQVHLKTATKATVEAPDAEFTGNVKVLGNLEVIGNSKIGGNEEVVGNTTIGGNATVTGVVAASGYTGSGGGPVQTNVDIVTTGNVSGGGTDLADVKAKFNGHTHAESNTPGGSTGTPSSTL